MMVTALCVNSRDVVPLIVRGNGVRISVAGARLMTGKAALGGTLCTFVSGGGSLSIRVRRLRHGRTHVIVSNTSLTSVRRRLARRNSSLVRSVGNFVGGFVSSGCRAILNPDMFVVLYDALPCPIVAPRVRSVVGSTPCSFGGGGLIGSFVAGTGSGVRLVRRRRHVRRGTALGR